MRDERTKCVYPQQALSPTDDTLTTADWRVATSKDDDAVIALVEALYAEDPSPEPVPIENARRTLLTLRRDPFRGRVVVLEADSAIVGYAFLIAFWSNELGGETCEIDELYVAPSHRSRGRGSELIEALANGSALWPGKPVALCLQVTPSNARARDLYERLGFVDRKHTMMVRANRP